MIDYINFALDHPHVFLIGTYIASITSLLLIALNLVARWVRDEQGY